MDIIKCFIIFLGGIIGAILGPSFCRLLVCCFGFTPSGIREGSEAARLMQEDGGYTNEGGLVSRLQSVGAAGFGLVGVILTSLFGCIVTTLITWLILTW